MLYWFDVVRNCQIFRYKWHPGGVEIQGGRRHADPRGTYVFAVWYLRHWLNDLRNCQILRYMCLPCWFHWGPYHDFLMRNLNTTQLVWDHCMNISREREGKGRRGLGGVLNRMLCVTVLWFAPPLHKHFDRIPLTGYDKWKPLTPLVFWEGKGGKAPMKAWYDYGASCNCVASEVQDELSRPMPATILQQQGIHPHPGPDYGTLTSIYDDECWEYWGLEQGRRHN